MSEQQLALVAVGQLLLVEADCGACRRFLYRELQDSFMRPVRGLPTQP